VQINLSSMRVRLLALAAIVAMTTQFFRNAHVVVAPDIMRELGASAQSLAALTSVMFLSSAIFQIPCGILLDRFGARRTIPVMLVVSGIGAGLFGYATSVGGLVVARAVMGAGGAVLVMAGIVMCARWFDPKHFSSVAGGLVTTSHLGGLGATVPMALIAGWFGWRGAYAAMLVFTCLLAVAVFVTARDAPPGHRFHARPRESLLQSAAGVLEVLRIPGLWRLLVMAWFAWAATSCVLSLWAGPYLSDVHRLDTLARGRVLFWMVIGMITGSLAVTAIDRWFGRTKRTIVWAAMVNIAIFATLAAFPSPGIGVATVLLTAAGIAGGYSVLIAPFGRQFYPDRLIGRGISTVNCAVLFGAASLQAASGMVVGAFATPGAPIPEHAFRAMFALLSVMLAGALACFWRCPDPRRTQTQPRA